MRNQLPDQTVAVKISLDQLYRLILLELYRDGEIRLNHLSSRLGLDVPDLLPAVDFLFKRGFVQQSELTGIDQDRTISLREHDSGVIGLDLGGTKLYAALSDLSGNILQEEEIQNHGRTGEACFEMIEILVERQISKAQKSAVRLLGIGIDVPGRVDLETGVVLNAPAVSMKDFPLKERMVTRFGLPVYGDNDLKQASLGEAWFGAGKGYRNVVLLAVGTGIAAGVVINGEPLRGGHLRLGELGWMVPGCEFLGRKYVGFGALEVEASGPGILERARRILERTNGASLPVKLDSEAVFAAAKRGEAWAVQCVDETAEYLALLVANVMAFYDPDVIILSGGVSRSSDMFVPRIRELVAGCVLTQPNIVSSSLGYRAGALGAIINLVQNCPEFIQGF